MREIDLSEVPAVVGAGLPPGSGAVVQPPIMRLPPPPCPIPDPR